MPKEEFGADIAAWASNAQYWASEEAAKKVRYLFIDVCIFSPEWPRAKYSVGHFMRNWQVGNFPKSGELPGETVRSQKIAEINKVIDDEFFLTNPAAYLTNNTSYANQVEETGWHEGNQNTPAYAPVARAIAASME